MGSAKGWAFENESECLNFIAGGGTPLNHKTISQQVVSGLSDDGELLFLVVAWLCLRPSPALPCCCCVCWSGQPLMISIAAVWDGFLGWQKAYCCFYCGYFNVCGS